MPKLTVPSNNPTLNATRKLKLGRLLKNSLIWLKKTMRSFPRFTNKRMPAERSTTRVCMSTKYSKSTWDMFEASKLNKRSSLLSTMKGKRELSKRRLISSRDQILTRRKSILAMISSSTATNLKSKQDWCRQPLSRSLSRLRLISWRSREELS